MPYKSNFSPMQAFRTHSLWSFKYLDQQHRYFARVILYLEWLLQLWKCYILSCTLGIRFDKPLRDKAQQVQSLTSSQSTAHVVSACQTTSVYVCKHVLVRQTGFVLLLNVMLQQATVKSNNLQFKWMSI